MLVATIHALLDHLLVQKPDRMLVERLVVAWRAELGQLKTMVVVDG